MKSVSFVNSILYLLLCGVGISFSIYAQSSSSFTRDTSFTIWSTAVKIQKDYPNAQLVLPVFSEKIFVSQNIEYRKIAERKLLLDIFSPSKVSGKLPAVLLIHGGGWRTGDKSMEHPMAIRLAENGFIAATVEYRLSPEAKFPAAIYDLKDAIRFLRRSAKKYNIDTKRIAVYGCSAGGELAAFLGATNFEPKYNGTKSKYSCAVQAVIDIDGILDFTDPAESAKDTIPSKPSAGKQWLGSSYRESPALWIEASPLHHASKKFPPILFVNSAQERFHAGRDSLIRLLNKWNIYSEIHTIPNTPHPFWLFHPWFNETADHIINFLKKQSSQ